MTNCNVSLCSTCRNQYNCQKYNSYIQSQSYNPRYAPTQSIQSTQPTQDTSSIFVDTSGVINNTVDSNSILQELSAFKDAMVDVVATRYLAIENQIKPMQSQINPIENQIKVLSDSVNGLREVIDNLSEKFSKLNSFIEMVEVANAKNVSSDPVDGEESANGLAIYTGEAESVKTLVEKTSKGFLGFGKKTEWVEEDKK